MLNYVIMYDINIFFNLKLENTQVKNLTYYIIDKLKICIFNCVLHNFYFSYNNSNNFNNNIYFDFSIRVYQFENDQICDNVFLNINEIYFFKIDVFYARYVNYIDLNNNVERFVFVILLLFFSIYNFVNKN